MSVLKDVEALEQKIVRAVKDVTKEAFEKVVDFSPTPGAARKSDPTKTNFSKGSYILSHNLSVGAPDQSYFISAGLKLNAPAKAKAKIRKLRLRDIKLGTPIYINNGISYADTVELVGWPAGTIGPLGTPYTGTLPYAAYRKAAAAATIYADTAVKAI